MADYYQVRNENVFNPPANTNLGNASNQFGNVFVQNNLNLGNVTVTSSSIITPKVSTITYPGDDTAADTAGGQTITLTGSGFTAGASVLINGSAVGIVSVVSSTTITFTSPANITGSYVIYVINPDGATAISIPGIQYSGTPNWTTAAGSLGSLYETNSFNQTVTATGDAPITYSVTTGSLPPGATFNSNGTITGTSSLLSSPTTYTFTVRATDAQQQDTDRSFSLVINPDVVTWSSPANGTTYTSPTNSTISNVVLSATSAAGSGITYTANSLPVGLSLSGNTISGTPTVEANSSSLLTATASTTSESSSVTINWVISVANDIYFKYNTLLLPGASTTYVDDASTNNFAITIIGDTKPNSMNPYSPGYYSNYFDGTSDYLQIANNTALNLSGGDFTLEAWVYVTVLPPLNGSSTRTACIMQYGSTTTNQGYEFTLDFTNNRLSLASIGTGNITDGSFSFALNTWYHVAATKSGSTNRLFVNGTSLTLINNTFPNNSSSSGFQRIGSGRLFTFYDHDLTGYISNARIVKGTAVYTANFTPSTTPLTTIANTSLLICQSNRFIDNSTNAFTITVTGDTKIKSFQPFTPNSSYSSYGSGYFDGSGDYLITPSSDAFNLGTGDFTYEAWIYPINNPIWGQIVGPAYNANGLVLFCHNRALNAYASGTVLSWDAIIQMDAWQHVVVTRQSGIISLYHNGVKYVNTVSFTGSLTNNTFYIGANSSGGETFTGHITDVRVVKGTAVYTTAFTPPTAPLTAISGASLLTLQNNQSVNNSTFLDNSTNNFLVTRNGNTTQGTFSPYGGNWSNYFDGTGDYLSLPSNAAFDFGTGDLTIECWIYVSSISTTYQSVFQFGDAAATTGFHFLVNTNTICLRTNSSQPLTTSGTILANTWNHIAITRASSTTKIFINGTTSGGTYNWTASLSSGTARLIGSDTYSNPVTGYISNARVVKGTAVYTANFTLSTKPLTPITNTSLLTCQSNSLIDNSINNFTVTKNGDVSVQRYSPFNPASLTPTSYSWNLYTLGSYQVTRNSTLSSLSTGAFTVEGWYYPTSSISSQNARILSLGRDSVAAAGDTSWDLYISNGSALVWQRIQTTATTYSANYTFNLNTWYHVVACRDSSSNLALFVNGTRILLQANVTTNYDYIAGSNSGHYIGASYNNVAWSYALGYYSNIRVIKGATAYDPTQTTLTVPTTPLTVTAQTSMLLFSNTGSDLAGNYPLSSITRIDSQSSMSTFNPFGYTSSTTEGYSVSTIGGSSYFDGSGDYLTAPSNAAFGFGTSDFTIEGWFYFTGTISTYQRPWWFGDDNDNLEINTSVIRYGGASLTVITGSTALANTWYHIAYSRQSGSGKLFINGTQVGSTTASSYSSSARTVTLMATSSGANPSTGYVSDFRITKGAALYTSNFAVPPTPLTPTGNTSLLLNMTSAGIYDAAMMNDMETVGDAKLSTAVSKFGGSSMAFDGTGDYIISRNSTINAFGTGDFTVESWFYLTSAGNVYPVIVQAYDGTYGPIIRFGNTGFGQKLQVMVNPASTATVWSCSLTQTAALNNWYHVALVRQSGVCKLYLNGTLQNIANGADPSTYPYTSFTSTETIGSNGVGFGDGFTGYIDDARITKGYARYTANFTAPTQALQTF